MYWFKIMEILEEIGLTPGEVKVYLALLELGSSSAGDIIDKSRLQNSVVHFCLNRLKEKGLVSYIKKGRKRIYTAADPENLLILLEDRKKALKEVLPQLKVKQKLAETKQTAEVFEGTKGLINMYNQLIADAKKGDEYLFFSADIEEKNEEIQNFYRKYDAKRKAKGLIVKGIAPRKLRPWIEGRPMKVKYIELPIANIAIFKDRVVFINWGEIPSGVIMTSKQISDKMRSFFNSLWKTA